MSGRTTRATDSSSLEALIQQLSAQISTLDDKFTARLDQQQEKFTALFEAQNATIAALSTKVDAIDQTIESKIADLQIDEKLAALESRLSTKSTAASNDPIYTIFTNIFQDDNGTFAPEKLRSFLEPPDDDSASTHQASITLDTVQSLIDQTIQQHLPTSATLSHSSSTSTSLDPPDAILTALSALIASHRRHHIPTPLPSPSHATPFLSTFASKLSSLQTQLSHLTFLYVCFNIWSIAFICILSYHNYNNIHINIYM